MDKLDREARSKLMSKVRHQDTDIEQVVRSLLHREGYRFRKNVRELPGSPDIVLAKYNAVVLVNGCFWHGHKGCKKHRIPATRHEFWRDKITANQERDQRNILELRRMGFRVAVVWQCVLERPQVLNDSIRKLEDWLNSERNRCEIPNNV